MRKMVGRSITSSSFLGKYHQLSVLVHHEAHFSTPPQPGSPMQNSISTSHTPPPMNLKCGGEMQASMWEWGWCVVGGSCLAWGVDSTN